MPRRPRIDPAGGIHHVMSQGWNKQAIYVDDTDRKMFTVFLRRACDQVGCEVIAFCLMGNHFHIVVRCPNGGLAMMMQLLLGRYARHFNRRHGRKGAVFAGRYKSVLITDDPHLLVTVRYVDRNPLELGYDITAYPWSSLRSYLVPEGDTDLVRTEFVLAIIGGPEAYRSFVFRPLPADKSTIGEGTRPWSGHVLADEVASIKRVVRTSSGRELDTSTENAAIALVAMDRGRVTAREVAEQLGLGSDSTVRSLARRARLRIERDDHFAHLVAEAEHLLRAA